MTNVPLGIRTLRESSDTAADIARARAICASLPAARLDRVLEVRRRIATGRFHPTAEEVAEAILAPPGSRASRR